MAFNQVPLHTINCADCGTEVETTRANTKVCSVCRLIRDMPFVADKIKTCGLCNNTYAPLDIRDRCCGDCAPTQEKHGTIVCAFCGKDKPRVRADIAVCNDCARDPDNRRRLWASLKHKQAQRREATQVSV